MKSAIFILFLLFFCVSGSIGQTVTDSSAAVKIEAQTDHGFAYPYYLYVPPEVRDEKERKRTHTILVLPNNTAGGGSDDFSVHEADVKKRLPQAFALAAALKVAVLMPVFPRPKTDWQIYTHALDRDAMITGNKEYARFDLQLIAMIDDARARLKKEKLKFEKRVLINGFSASGMFTNRFTFLHPARVKAAAVGSPGGWAIAPVNIYQGKYLRYPIGTSDLKAVSGHQLNLKSLRKVSFFIFLGDQDENDSVVFGDAYENTDKDLIFDLFGKTPVERWSISKSLYEQSGLNAQFKLYPNVKHTVTPEMREDVLVFLKKYAL